MNRGYIRIWRKIEDSGIMGSAEVCQLFLHLILKASSKARKQLVGNTNISLLPGQVIVGRKKLAAELNSSERKIRTCLATLENMEIIDQQTTNKYTVVSFVNWNRYQNERPTDDQQSGQDSTSTRPALDHKQEDKNNINTWGGGECAGARVASSVPEEPPPQEELLPQKQPKRTDCPSKGNPQWPAFQSCWDVYPVHQGQEEAWREWMRLHEAATLAQTWEIRDAILRLIGEDSRWQRGKVPKMAKWLNGKGWNDEPFVEPEQGKAVPAARTQAQQNKQNLEGLAAFVDAADKEFSHGITATSGHRACPHGNALPPSADGNRTFAHDSGMD